MEASELIARAKELLAKAETTVKQFESVEPTQLRIAVRRLELFIEQHLHLAEAEQPAAEATDDDPHGEEQAAPKRRPRAKTEE